MTGFSKDKRRLVDLMLADKGVRLAEGGEAAAIPRRFGGGPAPLASNQEGLWFLEQMEPGKGNFNIPGAVRLQGQLNVKALERSFNEIIRRHEALRTTFVTQQDGTPSQVVSPATLFALSPIDLRDVPTHQRETEVLRRTTDASQMHFDLQQGPLMRIQLLRLGEEEHVLILTIHHIVADGWSMDVLTKELHALYGAFLNGHTSPLTDLPIQYSDYARWERDEARSEVLQSRLSYWQRQLSGSLPVLNLPTDHARPAIQSFSGKHHPLRLPADLTEELRALSQREGATLFMTLLSVFNMLLCHLTRQTDLIVGTGLANRERPELENLIGYFATVLPLRTDLSDNLGFQQLVHRVRSVVLSALANQGIPLARLVQEIQPERDPSRNPLFQVEFTLLTPDRNPAVYGYGLSELEETIELPGLTMLPLPVEGGVSRFDLAVFLWDMPSGLCGTVEYSTDLFDAATIVEWTARFKKLIQLVVQQPKCAIRDLLETLGEELDRERSDLENSFKESMHEKLRRNKGKRRR